MRSAEIIMKTTTPTADECGMPVRGCVRTKTTAQSVAGKGVSQPDGTDDFWYVGVY